VSQEDTVPRNVQDLERRLTAQRRELSRLHDGGLGKAKARIEAKLNRIDEALEKLDQGTYGVCEGCGAAIEPERLEALPHATRCIGCEREAEAGPDY
jgi:DnaK suppressor protein